MLLDPSSPSAARGDDELLYADACSRVCGGRAGEPRRLTRREALSELAFLVEPPRGLAGRLLEPVSDLGAQLWLEIPCLDLARVFCFYLCRQGCVWL